ncbi:MAG: hypothetical protein FJ087_18185 [Deltaproteobacteria bacterium]|nr:hypothetical protein [Deltaproteobacteria bacterium]
MSRILAIGFAAAFLFAACGSDDGGSSGGTAGGTRDKYGACYGTTGQECTGIDEYQDCVISKCDTELKDMLGASYASGTFAGKCGEMVNFLVKCACGDTACEQACAAKMDADCQTAAGAVSTCAQNNCKLPTCGTPGGGGGSGCSGLKSCCNSMPAQAKDACLQAAGMMGEDACNQTLEQYEKAGVCK